MRRGTRFAAPTSPHPHLYLRRRCSFVYFNDPGVSARGPLPQTINVDVTHEVFEVQEEFAIGLGEIARARAAEKVRSSWCLHLLQERHVLRKARLLLSGTAVQPLPTHWGPQPSHRPNVDQTEPPQQRTLARFGCRRSSACLLTPRAVRPECRWWAAPRRWPRRRDARWAWPPPPSARR